MAAHAWVRWRRTRQMGTKKGVAGQEGCEKKRKKKSALSGSRLGVAGLGMRDTPAVGSVPAGKSIVIQGGVLVQPLPFNQPLPPSSITGDVLCVWRSGYWRAGVGGWSIMGGGVPLPP